MKTIQNWLLATSIAMSGSVVFGADAAPASDPALSLSSAMQDAIKQLSSEDFNTREKALKALERDLGEQMKEVFEPTDPESIARLERLAQFQEGFAKWILRVMTMPESDQPKLLTFGFEPAHMPIMGRLYSADVNLRLQGIRELAKIPGPEADALLGDLLSDPTRAVYVAAMEAAWDRSASPALVDPVWTRAVGDSGMWTGRAMGGMEQPAVVTFRGQPLQMIYENAYYRRTWDNEAATDVLTHWKSPLVEKKIVEMFDAMRVESEKAQGNRGMILTINNPQIKNLFTLAMAYKPNGTIGDLVSLASEPVKQRLVPFNRAANAPGKAIITNRTATLVLFVQMTGQTTTDYALREESTPWGNFVFESDAAEASAVTKMQEWWKANKEKYGSGSATQPTAAATQAATTQAN